MDIAVANFARRYRIAGPAGSAPEAAARLDGLADAVGQAMERAIERSLGDDPAVYVLPRVSHRTSLRLDAGRDDAELAESWGESLAAAVLRALAAGDGVVRFAGRGEHAARFLADLLAGRAWERRLYRPFAALRELPLEEAVAAVLRQHRGEPEGVLAALAAAGVLEEVLGRAGGDSLRELWGRPLGRREEPSPETARTLLALALSLADRLGLWRGGERGAEPAGDPSRPAARLDAWLAAAPAAPDWMDPGSLADALADTLRFLAERGDLHPAGRAPPAEPLAAVLADFDWLDTARLRPWLESRLAPPTSAAGAAPAADPESVAAEPPAARAAETRSAEGRGAESRGAEGRSAEGRSAESRSAEVLEDRSPEGAAEPAPSQPVEGRRVPRGRRPTPRQRDLLADLLHVAGEGGLGLERARPCSPANALRLYARLIERFPRWSGDAAARGLLERLLAAWQAAAGLPEMPRSAAAWARAGKRLSGPAARDLAAVTGLGEPAMRLLEALAGARPPAAPSSTIPRTPAPPPSTVPRTPVAARELTLWADLRFLLATWPSPAGRGRPPRPADAERLAAVLVQRLPALRPYPGGRGADLVPRIRRLLTLAEILTAGAAAAGLLEQLRRGRLEAVLAALPAAARQEVAPLLAVLAASPELAAELAVPLPAVLAAAERSAPSLASLPAELRSLARRGLPPLPAEYPAAAETAERWLAVLAAADPRWREVPGVERSLRRWLSVAGALRRAEAPEAARQLLRRRETAGLADTLPEGLREPARRDLEQLRELGGAEALAASLAPLAAGAVPEPEPAELWADLWLALRRRRPLLELRPATVAADIERLLAALARDAPRWRRVPGARRALEALLLAVRGRPAPAGEPPHGSLETTEQPPAPLGVLPEPAAASGPAEAGQADPALLSEATASRTAVSGPVEVRHADPAPPPAAPASETAAPPEPAAAGQQQDGARRFLAALGAGEQELLRALLERRAVPAAGSPAAGAPAVEAPRSSTEEAIEIECAGIFLLARAILDGRLGALVHRAAWPPGAEPSRLGAAITAVALCWAGEAAVTEDDLLDEGIRHLAGWDRPTDLAAVRALWRGAGDGDHRRFTGELLRLAAGQRLLRGEQLRLYRLTTAGGTPALVAGCETEGVWPFGHAGGGELGELLPRWLELWRRGTGREPEAILCDAALAEAAGAPAGVELIPVPAAAEAAAEGSERGRLLAAHRAGREALTGALAALDGAWLGDPGSDLAATLAAAALLRVWARWLGRFAGAGVPFLLENFIRRPGRLSVAGHVLRVELAPGPMDMVLEMAGYLDDLEAVPWLAGRRLELHLGERRGERR